MQIKLKVVKITQNEDGTITTKLHPELVGGGGFVSGELFVNVPNAEAQPLSLVYGAEVNSDLTAFVEIVETPAEPTA